MKLRLKLLRYVPLVLLAGLLLCADARAQRADSLGGQSGQEAVGLQEEAVTVRRGAAQRAAPASVQHVRRRIRQIGGRGTVRQVIYPMIVVPTVHVRLDQSGRPLYQQPAPDYYGGRDDGYRSPLSRMLLDDDLPYYGDLGTREGDDEILRLMLRRQRALAADSAGAPVDSLSAVINSLMARRDSLAPPRPEAPPTVQQVERQILETGLFRVIGVNFEFDESGLLPEARATIDVVAQTLEEYPELRVEVGGHTDAIGSAEYNQQLSERRAQAVRSYLVEDLGFASDRVTARGYGEAEPLASNETTTGRTLNRRVEFRVLNPEAAEQYREGLVPIDGEDVRPGVRLEESLRQIIREEIQRAQGNE